jgi:hypothetical protein
LLTSLFLSLSQWEKQMGKGKERKTVEKGKKQQGEKKKVEKQS